MREDLRPLADLVRPAEWDDFEGLETLDKPLVGQLTSGSGRPPSLVLWGPPGSGKTTFAKLVGRGYTFPFVEFSAVLGGVKDIRDIVAEAKRFDHPTILFLDEIHRFNKSQQDALLPHVEDGTLILIGATTENPSFYLNGALLSRCKVVVFPSQSNAALSNIVGKAAARAGVSITGEALSLIVEMACGDARKALNLVQDLHNAAGKGQQIGSQELKKFITDSKILFHDRSGEEHYNVVSAFIKSMRGSDPDAALYWGFRMIEGGEDPLFVIRRMIIFASEDIGNADPRALMLAVSTAEAFERVGMPEGKIPIAHCITYLASAPKSNRSYLAMHEAMSAVKENPKVSVPLHLRNAPTKLMKNLNYGAEYQYPHNFADGELREVQYLPDELKGREFYKPGESGLEKIIKGRLDKRR
ncbi:MAG: replication-associated recombination protein A [Deltaproteobacteria bacterium]|nr:replication-associated recombination protein A [Deltaproteobacteria bacterium]